MLVTLVGIPILFAIAAELVVTESAVEKHVSRIFEKLALSPSDSDHRRVLAVLAYLRAAG